MIIREKTESGNISAILDFDLKNPINEETEIFIRALSKIALTALECSLLSADAFSLYKRVMEAYIKAVELSEKARIVKVDLN